ncbi:MAG: prepilin-type N-terminal cleavage/methylation domain-containing protein [Anaerolineae bacterium]
MRDRPAAVARDERGFTLIEFTLATAIGALITGTLVVTLFYFNDLTTRYRDSLSVSNELQRAASLLNHDVVNAAEGEIEADALELVIYGLEEGAFGDAGATPVPITVTYALQPSSDQMYNLVRDGQTIARRIADPAGFSPVGAVSETSQITVTITTAVDRPGEDYDQDTTAELVFHRRPSKP